MCVWGHYETNMSDSFRSEPNVMRLSVVHIELTQDKLVSQSVTGSTTTIGNIYIVIFVQILHCQADFTPQQWQPSIG